MNKKGFTLIELVATIAILLLLATIAVVSVTTVLDKATTDIGEAQEKILENAAQLYYEKKIINTDLDDGKYLKVSVKDLKDAGLLKKDVEVDESIILYVNESNVGSLSFNSGMELSDYLVNVLYDNTKEIANSLYRTKDYDENYTYYYGGKNPNNYININGDIWRIIRVASDGTIKIISENSDKSEYNNCEENTGFVDNGMINDTLFNESNKITYLDDYTDNNSKNFCDNVFDNKNLEISFTVSCPNRRYLPPYGLIDMVEYNLSKKRGLTYISNTWTMNVKEENGVYNAWYIDENGNSNTYGQEEYKSYKLVVILKNNIKFSEGDGSSAKPYVIAK